MMAKKIRSEEIWTYHIQRKIGHQFQCLVPYLHRSDVQQLFYATCKLQSLNVSILDNCKRPGSISSVLDCLSSLNLSGNNFL
ncbi:hypothetical protein OIU77_001981 [Salix suchowensis]|uniref:Uncharacterized protein n=1 Tax=Salix suchowensis TaxID=1278906 RepID=A0ABQ9B5G6_9ROSI|nr:hypothetical protein OIU77_001981 [Salix suchowensis]